MTTAAEKLREVQLAPGIRIQVPEAPWSERERLAWYWPEPMLTSQWAERYRTVTKTSVPGPWRNDTAPYLRGIMDLADKRGVIRMAIKKATQLGVSEASRNCIGKWAHLDPSPIGLALPNKIKGEEIVQNELMPFFRKDFGGNPELRGLLTGRAHDIKKGQIRLSNEFLLHLMWSGSATSMASNPMKRAISDEVNKFEPWVGNDADAISLIDDRLGTYGDRLHMLISSPTAAQDAISAEFDDCTYKLYCLVACPKCSKRQRLIFGDTPPEKGPGVKWGNEIRKLFKDGNKRAAADMALGEDGAVWYECANENCRATMTERAKRQMIKGCKWGTVGKDGIFGDGVIADAEAVPEFKRGTRLGMHISALYGMWEGKMLAHVAAEFLSIKSEQQMFHFRTSTLGEDWERVEKKVDGDQLALLSKSAPPQGKLPKWTGRVIATIDTQKDHFYVIIRAWGPGMRSRRIWHGKVNSFDDIETWCRKTPWANEDPRLPARICDLAFIDTGGTTHEDAAAEEGEEGVSSRTMQVYAWALKKKSWVRCIKGDANPIEGTFIRRGRGVYVANKQKTPLPILLLSVHHFQDELSELMAGELEVVDPKTGEVTGKQRQWEINDAGDEEYNRHMENMQKVLEGKGAEMQWRWRKVRDGVRYDYRMCEVYQIPGAYIGGVLQLPDMPAYLQAIESELAEVERLRNRPAAEFKTPHGQRFLATRR